MMKIENFGQVRADGRIISSSTTAAEMIEKGWGVSRIVSLQWDFEGGSVAVPMNDVSIAKLVLGDKFVAVIDLTLSQSSGRMRVLSGDGSLHGDVDDGALSLAPEDAGGFAWFEPPLSGGLNIFGAIYETSQGQLIRCDIDASIPAIVAAVSVR